MYVKRVFTLSTPKYDTLKTIYIELSPVPNIDSNHKTNEKSKLSSDSNKSVFKNHAAHIEYLSCDPISNTVISQPKTFDNEDISELNIWGIPVLLPPYMSLTVVTATTLMLPIC